QHELGQRRAQREIAQAHRGAHPGAVGLADDRIVRDPAAIGVKRLRLPQKEEVTLAALIDEQHLLTVLEGKRLLHRVLGAGKKHAAANAASGVSALMASAAGRPWRSATQPSTARPRPPAPNAKPTMSPDAIPACRGR